MNYWKITHIDARYDVMFQCLCFPIISVRIEMSLDSVRLRPDIYIMQINPSFSSLKNIQSCKIIHTPTFLVVSAFVSDLWLAWRLLNNFRKLCRDKLITRDCHVHVLSSSDYLCFQQAIVLPLYTADIAEKIGTKTSFDQFAFVLFEFIVCYDRRRACATNQSQAWPITGVISKPKVKVVEHDRDGLSHIWCDPKYFHYPTIKPKK